MKPTEALPGGALRGDARRASRRTTQTVPYRRGGYFYYSRTEQGKQYPIYCRKTGSLDAPEEVTLDLNALAEGQPFFALGAYAVSDDGHLLAYSTDVTGFREYTLLREGPAHRARSCPIASRRSGRSRGPPTTGRSSTSRRTRPSARTGSTATRLGRRRATTSSTRRRTSSSASASSARAAGATSFSAPRQPHDHARCAICRPTDPAARGSVVAAARAGARVRRRPPDGGGDASTSAPTTAAGATSAWSRRPWRDPRPRALDRG